MKRMFRKALMAISIIGLAVTAVAWSLSYLQPYFRHKPWHIMLSRGNLYVVDTSQRGYEFAWDERPLQLVDNIFQTLLSRSPNEAYYVDLTFQQYTQRIQSSLNAAPPIDTEKISYEMLVWEWEQLLENLHPKLQSQFDNINGKLFP